MGALVRPEVGMLNHMALGQEDKCWVRNPLVSPNPLFPGLLCARELTRTSGHSVAVKGQSGHLKVLGPMWALL